MNTLPYLLTASLYLVLFYGCYWLLLRRNTFFGLNRAYLLASVALSLLLPLIELPSGTADAFPVGDLTLPTFVVSNGAANQSGMLTTTQWIWLLYGLGVLVMLVRLGLNLKSVFRLINRGSAEHTPTFILVRLPDDSSPSFSFGRYLVLNHTDSLTEPDALLRHEEAHIRQRHTADILFLELVQAALWFNPVVWLYKLALQEVHEFLADRTVLKMPQPDYPRQLVAYALNMPIAALTTPFVSKSTLKQRIIMLQKPASHRRALLGYALILPVAACLVMCTQSGQDQSQDAVVPVTEQAAARKAVKVDGEVFTVVQEQPGFPGGMKELGAYLSENLKYPAAAQKVKAEGRVFVSFIVTKTGEVTDVKLLKGIGFGTGEEAIRVVQNMPRWTPGTQNGKVVNVRYNLPINFTLEDKSDQAGLDKFERFIVNGKASTKEAVFTLSPNKIAKVNIDKDNKTIAITTK
ncbi:M56 family metallopeptidase [Spirosoma sp. KCTC 42546]|uniref:M56 family metallopeptidase n=1 Tax=Spirosoma sp. KCTC 42546 TaxID=2520506 RepID=UPI0011576DB0|nr:M56 family metallopeptidase [Spirosoma sp. KCTC 42546]QDK82797.1 M56 family metallopeptidase [Spirosoma sp. KCTC 42546]